MPQPGQFNPAGEDAVIRRIQDLERQVKELSAANPFKAMGIRPMPDGLIVDGYETVNGPLDVNGTTTVDGDSTFNGSLRINGPLILKPGSIQNDSLTSPLIVGSGNADALGFTVPKTTTTTITSFAFTVPAGYTKADVMAFGSAFIYNSAATTDYVYARVYVGTYGGMTLNSLIGGSGGSVQLTPNVTRHVEGLTGGATITCSIMMSTDNNAITHASNQANVTATAIFTR